MFHFHFVETISFAKPFIHLFCIMAFMQEWTWELSILANCKCMIIFRLIYLRPSKMFCSIEKKMQRNDFSILQQELKVPACRRMKKMKHGEKNLSKKGSLMR